LYRYYFIIITIIIITVLRNIWIFIYRSRDVL